MLKQPRFQWAFWPVLALLCACAGPANTQPVTTEAASIATEARSSVVPEVASIVANVLSVQVSGAPGAYTFAVEIASPDENCSQYADWWEVIDEEGQLLYRRVLTHSHADEQPFTRAGGPVPVETGTTVWIRAHMNVAGYGGAALHGSLQDGFNQAELGADFAADLAKLPPLPQDCAF